jgi:drug/metabolite transporter (DMT)-like permease
MVADTQSIPRRNLGYLLGLGGVLLAALCGSSAGILLRHIEAADGWQVLFYRSLSFSVLLFLVVVLRQRGGTLRAFRAIGWWGLAVALSLGGAFIAFVFAMLLTTVAEAVLILSAAPFVAAILDRAILGEAVAPATWLAMAGAACGIAIMMAGGLSTGGEGFHIVNILGGFVALIACVGYAFCIVSLRAGRARDMMPATCLAGVVALAVSAVFAAPPWPISGHDLALALLLGTGQIGLQYLLITLSARWVPAAEIALLMLLEVVLAPIWVWIGVGEVPATWTLIGGAVVVAALFGQGLFLFLGSRKVL